MHEKIQNRQYVITLHAEEEMDADGLTVFDVERVLLGGKIVERQKVQETNEWKYRIRGESIDARKIELIAKMSITGKVVIITVYEI